jgi:hypothetical protein
VLLIPLILPDFFRNLIMIQNKTAASLRPIDFGLLGRDAMQLPTFRKIVSPPLTARAPYFPNHIPLSSQSQQEDRVMVTFWTCIQEVLGSNAVKDTGYPEV